jgi:hypothetical protein
MMIGSETDVHALEYSRHSEDMNGFPFHIGTLETAVKKNLMDYYENNRGQNKWQIIFIGTYDECQKVLEIRYEEFLIRQCEKESLQNIIRNF